MFDITVILYFFTGVMQAGGWKAAPIALVTSS